MSPLLYCSCSRDADKTAVEVGAARTAWARIDAGYRNNSPIGRSLTSMRSRWVGGDGGASTRGGVIRRRGLGHGGAAELSDRCPDVAGARGEGGNVTLPVRVRLDARDAVSESGRNRERGGGRMRRDALTRSVDR